MIVWCDISYMRACYYHYYTGTAASFLQYEVLLSLCPLSPTSIYSFNSFYNLTDKTAELNMPYMPRTIISFVCLSVCLSVCVSVCVSVCLSVCLSLHLGRLTDIKCFKPDLEGREGILVKATHIKKSE